MTKRSMVALSTIVALGLTTANIANDSGTDLLAAIDAKTPLVDDLKYLTDTIGGRATGSPANAAAVSWIASRLKEAGLTVSVQPFDLPRSWNAKSASAHIEGSTVSFNPTFVPRVYSSATPLNGISAPLLDVGKGTAEDFAKQSVTGAFVLVHTDVLDDAAGLHGLFGEYVQSYHAKSLAAKQGAVGVIYVSSRPKGLMMRHVAIKAAGNDLITATIDRENALRAQRAISGGDKLTLTTHIQTEDKPGGTSHNIIAEIKGSENPDEIVLIGAHMDSHDLGTGALDNGTNTAMVMDIARQITKLGLKPKRTIRFALWNAEEYGLLGSGAYVSANMAMMDNHIVTMTHDIGVGRINGYLVNGGAGLLAETNTALATISSRGPFQNIETPIVGTDNYDFMMVGVPNLVASQEDATYASNYHAQSDTFDKVDLIQLRKNTAIAAQTVWHFANSDWRGERATPETIAKMVKDNNLYPTMDGFGLLDDWRTGKRGFNPNPEK